MSIDFRKRGVFTSLFSRLTCKEEKPDALRPPYAKSEEAFTLCKACINTPCVAACEERIIMLDALLRPRLFFTERGCTFCKECALSCPLGVLEPLVSSAIHAQFRIDIASCMAWNKVVCYSCADVCNEKAIDFFGTFRPTIDIQKCSACGFCYGVCPSHAIRYKGIQCEV